MNYLSHYFLDAKPGEPYFNFGLVLPDMLGASARSWKPVYMQEKSLADHVSLLEGIQRHHLADAYFHNSEFFTENTKNIRLIFEKHGFSQTGTKLFFVAHIFLEFFLDRLIMQENETLAKHFYEDIDMVEKEILSPFFIDFHASESFFNFLHNFRKHRYLYSYLEDNSLFYSLNRTLMRGGQMPFTDNKSGVDFKLVVEETDQLVSDQYQDFFKEMKGKL